MSVSKDKIMDSKPLLCSVSIKERFFFHSSTLLPIGTITLLLRELQIYTHKLGIAGWSLKILGTSHKHSLLNVKAKSMLAVTYFTMETFSLQ